VHGFKTQYLEDEHVERALDDVRIRFFHIMELKRK
jgi:hypothetical protein